MKKYSFLLIALLLTATSLFAQDEYYFAGKGKLNPTIPTPESFFGFRIGTALVRYDKVVEYFKLLASKSDRASLQVFGKTWEDREQVKLFVTATENQRNLETIRQEHLKLVDPEANADINNQKIIVELGYNVHGGEIAGTDASVLVAYYLVASEDPEILKQLNDAVILIEPSENPDGRERAANYINGFHSWPPVSDPADREHSSGLTPHRGNHFWADLNRDWLALSQIESRNRVAFYHKWYPNVYLDYHEMGSSSTYYFEPSPKQTWNKIIPSSNYEVLNELLAKQFSAALNGIGSLYYTKESFTNQSPIYGSTYPDYQGGVGTTLEIGSTSGVALETAAGLRTFSKNLRDNFLTSIAAVRAATEKKSVFLNYQKDFFKTALTQADKQATKSIVFGSKDDKSLNSLFINHLLQHHINVYELTSSFTQDGKKFEPGTAYVVPLHQSQYRILQSIFEENETNGFTDSTTFYDASAASTVHGFGIPFAKVKTVVKTGTQVAEAPQTKGVVSARSELAYAFEFFDYLTPKALYFLEDNGVKVRVSQQAFTSKTATGDKNFARGSIVIPVAYQTLASDEIYRLLNEAAKLANINIYALTDGYSVNGIDLGSNNIRVLKKPVVAVIAGGNWTSIGELWALLGNTHNIPLVKIDAEAAERVDLSKYTSIILNGGQLTPKLNDRIKAWVENGGTLIALSGAAQWASSLIAAPAAPAGFQRRGRGADSTAVAPAAAATAQRRGGPEGERVNGIIVRAELNLAHQLTYGFTSKDFYTLKNSTTGINGVSENNVVLKINDGVLVDGYTSPENLAKLKNKVVIATGNSGNGSVLIFGESPTFRGYWLAPGRILTNALFFGAGSARGRGEDAAASEEEEN
jgi:Zinc carboxypeptidase